MHAALQDERIGTVIEVSGANYGCVPLASETLLSLHDIARAAGVVLIFDETITGFRWSSGGRQARDGIVPDLTTLAKSLTGGLPGGAVCGRADIMELMNNTTLRNKLAPAVSHKARSTDRLLLLLQRAWRCRCSPPVRRKPGRTRWPLECVTA